MTIVYTTTVRIKKVRTMRKAGREIITSRRELRGEIMRDSVYGPPLLDARATDASARTSRTPTGRDR